MARCRSSSLTGMPLRLEGQFRPDSFELGEHLPLGDARVGHQFVDERAEHRAHVAAVRAAVAFQQPAQRAVGEHLKGGWRHRHDVILARPQWRVGGRGRGDMPLVRRRHRERLPRPVGRIALRHRPARRRRRHRRARTPAPAADRPPQRARAHAAPRWARPRSDSAGGSVASAASSSQNADGMAPSSPSPSTAVTSTCERARPSAETSSRRSSASTGALVDTPRTRPLRR